MGFQWGCVTRHPWYLHNGAAATSWEKQNIREAESHSIFAYKAM